MFQLANVPFTIVTLTGKEIFQENGYPENLIDRCY